MKILIVDDSEDCRELTEAALQSGGFTEIATHGSAQAAFNHLDLGGRGEKTEVDLILLDIVMPDIDGIEACGRIRRDARYADVPIIMVTSLADTDSLASAFDAGANDYIGKPVSRVELMARVRAAMKVKAELAHLRAREQELLSLLAGRD